MRIMTEKRCAQDACEEKLCGRVCLTGFRQAQRATAAPRAAPYALAAAAPEREGIRTTRGRRRLMTQGQSNKDGKTRETINVGAGACRSCCHSSFASAISPRTKAADAA